VIGPLTGQISPEAACVDDAPFEPCWACAARIRSAIALLAAWSASISPASTRSAAVNCDRSVSFLSLLVARSFFAPTSWLADVACLRGARRDDRGLALHRSA